MPHPGPEGVEVELALRIGRPFLGHAHGRYYELIRSMFGQRLQHLVSSHHPRTLLGTVPASPYSAYSTQMSTATGREISWACLKASLILGVSSSVSIWWKGMPQALRIGSV